MSSLNLKSSHTARAVSEHQLRGINRQVKLSVIIEGRVISHYRHLSLEQYSHTHHHFELELSHDTLGAEENHQLQSANSFLGKRITLIQKYREVEDSPERTFVGVITKVSYRQQKGGLGTVILSGGSPTLLMDAAPHTQSFGGDQSVNMSIIAREVISQALSREKFDLRIEANDHCQIPYSAQYEETHYNYLCRMAVAYGEQFYYDGEILHLGKLPAPEAPLTLHYGSNVSNIQVDLNAVHIKPEFYGYNSSQHTKLTSGETPASHKSDLAKTAYRNNDQIFKTRSLQVAPLRAQTDQDVVSSQQSAWGHRAVDVFTVSGDTSIPFLYPGCVCDLEMRKTDSTETSYFTRIMITEVTHDLDATGRYKGSFKAIASDTGYLPEPEFTTPTAQPQMATVISNADPQGQGRVTVRFDWQLHDTTSFIRMMSPDAGGTDQVTQNRGYVAIPEVGDQVMVGFVHNHPDRPFVMGGMFHGQVGLGGGSDNRVKSIQTRSGHRIIFTEDESIVITDKSGNEIHLDTTGSNISITAPETMTLNCKNMNINVGENMTSTIGNNQSTSVGQNQSNSVGMNQIESIGFLKTLSVGGNFLTNVFGSLVEFVKGNRESKAKEVKENSKRREIISQGNNNIHSRKTFNNNSGENSKHH
ncbi:phage baseplate assembly protein V [Chryseobacterium salipaludis]|uniref:type VI secretion system Vgr family protein n=1 Tax=Chryseobacterium TaxID=59732 RepID=UPI001FF28C7F|nr:MULTISPECIES: phage baseplate assembly protein V [Chryseobacterium]MCJ8497173.1 phage baseplate assembly protein V [Chryseobacterium salipaludis]MCX3295580.1 phage baseplate assembly protein V [Planobacterium sp. JC490]